MDRGNGNGSEDHPNGVRRLVITLDVHTQHVHIDGGQAALDELLGMMERARLELDARYRFNRGRELLAESMREATLQQAAQDAISRRIREA